jgi:putative PIN family toxin of toxin-antitoxin system
MSAASSKPAAVLDANLVISGIINQHGPPNQVLRAFQRDAFTLIASDDLTGEVAQVLNRDKIRLRYRPDPATIRFVLASLRAARIQPLPLDALPVHCSDLKDDPILACALSGNADFLVIGDQDLLELDGHPAIGTLRIVTPRAFLDLLSNDPDPPTMA